MLTILLSLNICLILCLCIWVLIIHLKVNILKTTIDIIIRFFMGAYLN